MKKVFLTLIALLTCFLGNAQGQWAEVYKIDYSTCQGFPFYVMGYVPEFDNGCMTDFGANFKYVQVTEDAEETSDVTVKTADGTEYYRWTEGGGWHQYFIADGIPTKIYGKYKVIAKVRASAACDINVNMSWGWGKGQSVGTTVAIPEGSDFQEVKWIYDGIGGSSCNLVAQPGDCTETIEWLSLEVYEWQKEDQREKEWLEDITNGDAETPWTGEQKAIAFNDNDNNYKICAWSKEKGRNMNEDDGWDPFVADIEVDPTDESNHVFVVHGKAATTEGDASAWDNQFWIQSKHAWKAGMSLKIKFRYMCDYAGGDVTTSTQVHKQTPSDYLVWHAIGDITFTNEWQTFDGTMTIAEDMVNGWSISFNLNDVVKDAVNFYFDDLSWQYLKLDEGYFVSGINTTTTDSYDDLDSAIQFTGTDGILEAVIGEKGNAASYVDQVLISTVRGDDRAFMGATLKPEHDVKNDLDDWQEYTESANYMIDLPSLGVWKIYLNTKSNTIAFEMLGPDPVDIVTNKAEIVVHAQERDWLSADGSGNPRETEIGTGETWDNQFFLVANRTLAKGEVTALKFKYKASKEAKTSTLCYGNPSDYVHWSAIGDINFTNTWQDFERDFIVPNEADGMQSIAFNMAEIKEACDYEITDIQWYLKDDINANGKTYENLIDAEGTKNFFVKEGKKQEIKPYNAQGQWAEVYKIDYSTYQGFPFYVMDYVPECGNGCMTDMGNGYRCVPVDNEDGVTSDVIVKTIDGVEYYRVENSSSEFHHYFIADGIQTKIDGKYKVVAKVRASEACSFNVNMGWGWDSGEQKGCMVSIPEGSDFQEVEWQYDGIGGTSCNLVAQPQIPTMIEWLSLEVYEWQEEGTLSEDVITVAKALELINDLENGGKSETEYFVKGYVIGISEISTVYGNATFDIADTNDGNQNEKLTVYRASGYNGEKITDENFLKLGDEVVVKGYLSKYVDADIVIPEISKGQIVSKKEGQITVAKALELINDLENGSKSETEYSVKGYVIGISEISTVYGNATFDIADTNDGNQNEKLTVYRASGYNGEKITDENFLRLGDEVVVKGYLSKYVNADIVIPEISQGQIVSKKEGQRPKEWLEDITNGDAETPWTDEQKAIAFNDNDNNYKICAWSKEKGRNMNENDGWDPFVADIEVDPTDESNHVFVVHGKAATTEGDASAWDNQFWIESKHAWKAGTTLKIKFRYMCDYAGGDVTTSTQTHKQTPSDYLVWHAIGDITFTNEWQTFDGTVTIAEDMVNGWSVSFNLNTNVKDAVNFYFDDLSCQYLKLDEGYFVSGINTIATDSYDDLDNAIQFTGADGILEAVIGEKGNSATYVNQIMISTNRGDDQAFIGATLYPYGEIQNDPDKWLRYVYSRNTKLYLPGLGVWKIYINTESNTMAFEMLEGYNYITDTPQISRQDNVLTISTSTEGATIYYTLDGSTPTTSSNVYTNPITLTQNCTVKAIAVAEGYEKSDVATYSVNWFKVENVDISFMNLKVILSTVTANARIYYTTDGSTPTENSTLYTEPFAVSGNCTVKAIAYKDNFNPSEVTSLYIDLNNVKCDIPTFLMSGNMLTITSQTEGTTIFYTLDGTMPTTSSERYTGPITLTRNGIVKAIAVKDGYLNSEVGSYEVNYFQVEMPSFAIDGNILTISCGTQGASIYYVLGDGALEITEQNRYWGPITLTDNRAVRAVGVLDGYRNSEEAVFRQNSITCGDVAISFDGHYVRMSSTTDGASIYYTTNGSNPTNASEYYTGPFAVNTLCTINAIATKENMNSSKVAMMELMYVYDGTSVIVKEAGLLSKAFEWNQGMATSNKLEVKGPLNAVDMEFIKTLSAVEHLDMKNVTFANQNLTDQSFANMNLISIELPVGIAQAGKGLFAQCNKLAAIVWHADCKLTEEALSGLDNPNLLVYANSVTYAPSGYNVINLVNNKASNIVLSDVRNGNGNFYCPRKFTAQKITYSRDFKLKSGINESAGWETIALPFNVEKITHEKNGLLAPFNSNVAGSKPFWLYNVNNNDFNPAMEIVANTPYIICMPNHENYADEYNQGGIVEFSANNVEITPTQPTTENLNENGIALTPVFTAIEPSDKVYAINFEEYEGHAPGNLFVRNLRTVYPFEAYLTINSALAPRYVPIFDNGHITYISDVQLLRGQGVNDWYTLDGRKLQNAPTIKGMYIRNGKKVVVK